MNVTLYRVPAVATGMVVGVSVVVMVTAACAEANAVRNNAAAIRVLLLTLAKGLKSYHCKTRCHMAKPRCNKNRVHTPAALVMYDAAPFERSLRRAVKRSGEPVTPNGSRSNHQGSPNGEQKTKKACVCFSSAVPPVASCLKLGRALGSGRRRKR